MHSSYDALPRDLDKIELHHCQGAKHQTEVTFLEQFMSVHGHASCDRVRSNSLYIVEVHAT